MIRLRDVLLPLVALASGAALACGGTTSGLPRTAMPARATCIDVTADGRYARLSLGPGNDGVALFTRAIPDDDAGASTPLPPLGVPCGGATDRAACASKVTAAVAARGTASWTIESARCRGCALDTLDLGVVTRGDDVELLPDIDALVATARPIDTLDEAVAVLQLKGYGVDCDTDNAQVEADGFVFRYVASSCSGRSVETLAKVTRDGEVLVVGTRVLSPGDNSCIEGRRPAGLVATGAAWLSSVEACFAEIAHMEAAAVLAFASLGRELARRGAPAALLARIERAHADEIEHARVTDAIARSFGGIPSSPVVEGAGRPPSLLDLAIENAVEGCVRETFGALVAAFQGCHARDEVVRDAFQRIAEEESVHAELSHALDAWYQAQLSPTEREAVESAKHEAFETLAHECMHEPAPEVVRVAGMPTAHQAARLLGTLPYAIRLLRAAA